MRRALLVLSLLSTPALAGGVGFAQATGYFKKDTRPTLYQPLNLLDARDGTAWCSTSSDPLNELLTFGFTAPTKIDEVRITTGNNFNESTWGEFARAHKLVFAAGKQTHLVTLEDKRGQQLIVFDKPFTTTRLSLEIRDQFPAEDPDQPVCITDIVFVSDGKPLNGQWLTTKLKYDKNVQSLMGTWFAGYEGGPDRFLALHYDGTFRYSFEPYDTARAQPKSLEGKWDVQGSKLLFEVGGKKFAPKFSKDPAKKGHGEVLTFDGDVPDDLKGPYRSTP
ncbi:MAG: hypothetical protein ABTQ32_05705 [Myxococcaceae bacterium]